MQKTYQRNTNGFTLLELLVVMGILIILLAFLVPVVMSRWEQANAKNAEVQVKTIMETLEIYKMDHGTYPTTQQGGLNVLIGLEMTPTPGTALPGSGMPQPGVPSVPGVPTMPGTPGADPMTPGFADPSANPMGGMMPDATRTVGSDPSMMGMSDPMNPAGMGTPGMVPPGQSGMDPLGPGGMQPTPGMGADPMLTPPGTQPGMTPPVGVGGTPTTPTAGFNPMQGSGKGKNYFGENAKLPVDPWGNPYLYEYPTNRTVSGKPAVWSQGKNKESVEDDIISWKAEMDQLKDPAVKAAFEARQRGGTPGAPSAPGLPNPMQPGTPGLPGQPEMFPGTNQPGMPPTGLDPMGGVPGQNPQGGFPEPTIPNAMPPANPPAGPMDF